MSLTKSLPRASIFPLCERGLRDAQQPLPKRYGAIADEIRLAAEFTRRRDLSLRRAKPRSFEPLRKFSHVDDNPRMRTDADLFGAFGCPDGELDLPPVDFRHLGLSGD